MVNHQQSHMVPLMITLCMVVVKIKQDNIYLIPGYAY